MSIKDRKYKYIDLQLFADEGTGEKTEKATPRRREEARKKGQTFKSVDLSSAIILIVGSVGFYLSFAFMVKELAKFTSFYLLERSNLVFNAEFVRVMFLEVLLIMAKVSLPVIISVFIAALLINYLQVGFLFSPEALSFNFERLNPVTGFKQKFSKRALVELIKSLLKVIITSYIVFDILKKDLHILPAYIDMSLKEMFINLGQIFLEITLKVGGAFIIIGLLDYLYQWFEYENSLKMSKYDVKQEYKQTEGDPHIKSRQKQIQRSFAMKRMMAEVPHADVVITNPTHFAVALKYEPEKMEAPMVVAKGQDFIAQKIREVALANGVIVTENPPLARALFHTVEINQIIPAELFQAVAEVLAFVYKQKRMAF